MLGYQTSQRVRQRMSAACQMNATAWSRLLKTGKGWKQCRQYHSVANRENLASAGDSTCGKQMGRHFRVDNDDGEIDAKTSSSTSARWTISNRVPFIFLGLVSCIAGAYALQSASSNRMSDFLDNKDLFTQVSHVEASAKIRIIEDRINRHPLVAEMRQRPEFAESRPHLNSPEQQSTRNFSANVLTGPGKILVPAYVWTEKAGKSLVSVVFVGEDLCSYPGIVHGGFLATMLDEGLARCGFSALPYNVGVTANLTIDYRKPVPTGTILVVRAETIKVEGRKAWVKGQIESFDKSEEERTVYAEASALFVSPKFASTLPKVI